LREIGGIRLNDVGLGKIMKSDILYSDVNSLTIFNSSMNEQKQQGLDTVQETNTLSLKIAETLAQNTEFTKFSDKQMNDHIVKFLDAYLMAKTIIDEQYRKKLDAARSRVREIYPLE